MDWDASSPSSVGDNHLPDLFTPAQWRELAAQLGLTPRQRQIARLACRGLKREAIAYQLGIKDNTVRTHIRAMYEHLGISSRLELVVRLVLTQREMGL